MPKFAFMAPLALAIIAFFRWNIVKYFANKFIHMLVIDPSFDFIVVQIFVPIAKHSLLQAFSLILSTILA